MIRLGFLFTIGSVAALVALWIGWAILVEVVTYIAKTIRDVRDWREQQTQAWLQPWQRSHPNAWRYTWLARRINIQIAKRRKRIDSAAIAQPEPRP